MGSACWDGNKCLPVMLTCKSFYCGIVLITLPYLHNAHSVKELKNEEREKGEEKFCVFHMELTVAATIFSLGMVQPVFHIPTRMAISQTAYFQGINKHPKDCQEGVTCA